MVKRLLGMITISMGIVLCGNVAQCAVIVNEVLANEPGSETTLEWIELYNTGQTRANLQLCSLTIGGTTVHLTDTMAPGSYLIVCSRLFSTETSPGFESAWGNNTGVWGDTSTENYLQPIDASFSLRNANDTVTLLQFGVGTSTITWSTTGKDGYSWERVRSNSDEIKQAVDYAGSTPGFVNSVTSLTNDLSIDNIAVISTETGSEIDLTITNMGTISAVSRRLLICAMNPAMPDSLGEILDSLIVPVLFGGYSTDIVRSIPLAGVYQYLIAALDSDERARNNRRAFMAAGSEFPPLILTELMTHPQLPLATEWIELYCPLQTAFHFQMWSVADNTDTGLISPDAVTVEAGRYIVLAEDTAAFRSFYTDFRGTLIQPVHWRSLNDDGDALQLIDQYGITADSFTYSKSYDGNFSWALDMANGDNLWGRSVEFGGSPGRENDVVIEPDDQRLSLTIEPRVFSPNSDPATITLEAPPAIAYTLKIYDRDGRVVRTLINNEELIHRSYTWNGCADSGSRLPIGIYICYFEAVGVQAIKKTVVIAR